MIIQNKINIRNEDLYFYRLDNDETFYGAIAGLQQNIFNLDKIAFNNNDIIIDFGCNIGIISLILAKLYPNIKVYSFDPSEIAIRCLKYSINKNNLTNIYPFHLAVGAENKYVQFSYEKDHISCLMEKEFENTNEQRIVDNFVKKIKIDEIFDSNLLNINRVKFLKCDIEGGEYEIFNHLIDNRPDILDRIEYINLELHRNEKFISMTEKLKEKMENRYGEKISFQIA